MKTDRVGLRSRITVNQLINPFWRPARLGAHDQTTVTDSYVTRCYALLERTILEDSGSVTYQKQDFPLRRSVLF
jgi:hypothetical protein